MRDDDSVDDDVQQNVTQRSRANVSFSRHGRLFCGVNSNSNNCFISHFIFPQDFLKLKIHVGGHGANDDSCLSKIA